MGVGTRLRELREGQNLTQDELAQKARIARNTVARIEQGRLSPSADTLEKLADGLGVEPGALFPKKASASPSEAAKFANDAEEFYAEFANLYNHLPEQPVQSDLDRIEDKLNIHATYFFRFLDDLSERGITDELARHLEGGGLLVGEERRLYDLLRATLTKALPSCTDWLVEQSRRYDQAPGDNVVYIDRQRERYAKKLAA